LIEQLMCLCLSIGSASPQSISPPLLPDSVPSRANPLVSGWSAPSPSARAAAGSTFPVGFLDGARSTCSRSADPRAFLQSSIVAPVSAASGFLPDRSPSTGLLGQNRHAAQSRCRSSRAFLRPEVALEQREYRSRPASWFEIIACAEVFEEVFRQQGAHRAAAPAGGTRMGTTLSR